MIWTGLLIGFLGSLHCIGMCGPLALAVPAANRNFGLGRLVYNAGRIATYMALGLAFGALGKSLALAGLQRGLSIAAGVIILFAVIASTAARLKGRLSGLVYRATGPVRSGWSILLRHSGYGALFGMGLLNGLLPCGLVYVGLAAAAGTGRAADGAALMALFGVGTLPAMLAISLLGRPVHAGLRLRFQRLVPATLVVLAALFILRGLSLGIPYLSPDLSGPSPSCCHATTR